jgi:uncharacterized membrane protein
LSEITPQNLQDETLHVSKGRIRTVLHVIAAFLSLAGLADSIYLTVEHLTGESATCIAFTGCAEVLGSKYAAFGPIPLAAAGAIAYFSAFSLATLIAFGYLRARIFFGFVVTLMLFTTIWLLYLQAFVLHAFCDYCLLSAALTLSLGVVAADSILSWWRVRGVDKSVS